MPSKHTVHTPTPSDSHGKSLHVRDHGAVGLVHDPLGPCPSCFGCTLTKTIITAERKAEKEAKAKLAEEKKLAVAACKADMLAKKQEKRISTAKNRAQKAANKADELCGQLAAAIKAASMPDTAHLHKRIKGESGHMAPASSSTAPRLLSPTWKPMSTKKRISLQSPQCTSLQREEPSLSDKLVSMSLSSASGSWVSSVTSERSDSGSNDPLLPSTSRHPSPAQGRGGHRYSAPGCGCTWTNFSRGSFAERASTGVRSTANLVFAWRDKGVD